MAGYVRQSAADIVPTGVVRAAPINNELNALRDAFATAAGHRHDGTAAEGHPVPVIGDADLLNKIATDTSNNRHGVFVEVAAAAVEQVRFQDGAIVPVTDNDIDLGTSALEFKDLYIDGTANIDSLVADTADINGGTVDATVVGASTPAAGTFTTLTANTSLVAATADINAGTIDGAVIGGAAALAITGTTVTATTGFVGGLTGAVTGNTAGTHTGAVVGNVTGNLTGNVTASTGTSTFNDVTINGGLNMDAATAATITNLTSPTNAGDAATKGYVDTADALKLNLAGGTMSGAIAMGTNKITGLGTPTLSADATTKTYVDTADALKLNLAGGTMSGAIAMGTSKITGLGDPTLAQDAATKTYVDTSISNLVAAAPGALDTLDELAAALGDDANFATTVTNSIATKLALAGGTMSGAIAMGTNKITGVGNPTLAQDAATKTYVDTADALKLNLAGGTMSGAIAMGTSQITGLGNPTLAQDAATKTYVDTADALKLNLAGGTMSGAIAMGTSKITGMGDPTANQDAATKVYVDTAAALKLSLTGGTMSGAIAMGTSKITGLGTPTDNADATTKLYVDGILGSATAAAASASAAATSASNAATSASNASTSASNASTSASAASTSATNAAASYDSFDDRYLGSKASAPSVDNDGNTLLVGALYWNSTSSELYLWTGSAWTQAAFTASGFATLTGTETLTNKTLSTVDQTKLQYATSVFPAIKPSLLLDFANTKQLDSRITYTRASTASFYNGVTTAKAEENLCTYSQELIPGPWGTIFTTVTANSTTAPDGTTTAETITEDTTTNAHSLYQTPVPSMLANTAYTFSVFVKNIDRQYVTLGVAGTNGTYFAATYDLTGVTVTATNAVGTGYSHTSSSITSVGNSWYRLVVSGVVGTGVSGQTWSISLGTNGTPTLDGRGREVYLGTSKAVYAWGAQCEQRSAATAYTATTTQAITNYIPVLQTAASGVARFDNNPTTGESLGLLIEESRTNLTTYSSDFSNAAWTKSDSTITANTVVAPDGTLTGDEIVPNTTSTSHYCQQSYTKAASAITYSTTVYVKSNTTGYKFLISTDDAVTGGCSSGIFNLSTGVFDTSSTGTIFTFVSQSGTSVGNGWYRINFVITTNTATALRINFFLYNSSNNSSFAGNGFSGVFLWGAQLEVGAFATSYIPTVASQVTRAADAASMTGTNFSSWYNTAEGTIYSEINNQNQGIDRRWAYLYDGSNGVFGSRLSSGNSYVLTAQETSGTARSVNGATITSTSVKVANAYKVNDLASSQNGSSAYTGSTWSPISATSFVIGSYVTAGQVVNNCIKKIAYYPLRVTNAQLQALTS
jgi:hypothetical protein